LVYYRTALKHTLNIVCKDGTIRRIVRHVISRALKRRTDRVGKSEWNRRNVEWSGTRREENEIACQCCVSHRSERRIIVEDIEAASERPENEIAFALLNGEVPHLNRRQSAVQLEPLFPAVSTDEQSPLRSR